MTPLPNYRPQQLSLGPLEYEILQIVWQLGGATVKDVHEHILSNPERELAYTSVTTVLRRLTNKGWLECHRQEKAFYWEPLISKEEAQSLKSYEQLQQFLSISNPDVVAAFADSMDTISMDKLRAIAAKIESVRNKSKE